MTMDIKVAATGVIALCLTLSALLYLSGVADPSLGGAGDRFFGLAVALIAIVVLLSIFGVKVKLP